MKVLGTSKVKVCNLNSNLANIVGGLRASFLALVIIGSYLVIPIGSEGPGL